VKRRGPAPRVMTKVLHKQWETRVRLLRELQEKVAKRSPAARDYLFPPAGNYTCDPKRLIDAYNATLTGAPNSIRNFKHVMSKISRFFNGAPMTREMMLEWHRSIAESSLAQNTKHIHSRVSRKFTAWCFAAKMTPRDLLEGVKMIQPKPQEARPVYTHEEYRKVLEVCDRYDNLRATGFIIKLGWWTGMAISDCCDLVWRDVDLERCIIKIRRMKTGTEAMIPFEIGGELHTALLKQRDLITRVYGSTSPGLPVCREFYQRRNLMHEKMAEVTHKAGIPHRTFHSWRATFMSACANNGVNTALAMKMVGIRSEGIFAKYVTPSEEALRREVVRVRG
jgi:integrase